MLYKNDEIYRLTAADHKMIKDLYPKFPIRLTYPEHRIKKNPKNPLPDQPNSISFPLKVTVKSKMGADEWRYAEQRIVGEKGQIIWYPATLMLRGPKTLQETDMELVWWLVTCCPWLEGGKNYDGKPSLCAIEDLRGKAEKTAMREEEVSDVKALIYSSKIGLGEKKLRTIAKAYFISESDDMTFPQIKIAVEKEVMRDKENGIKKFLELCDAEQIITIKSNLQNAIDKKIIAFNHAKRNWEWVSGVGKKRELIAQVVPAMDENEALYDYYMGNQQFAIQLTSALKGKKLVMADADEEPEE